MTSYDLGDGVPLEHYVYDRDGNLVSATVALTLTKPSGTTVIPTITNVSAGFYRAAIVTADETGTWVGVWSVSGSVIDSAPVSFQVLDPGPQAYIDLVTVKNSLGKLTVDDRDDLIQAAISAASRMIDRRCGRRFWADKTATARTFLIDARTTYVGLDQVVMVDDISTATGLAVSVGSTGNYGTSTGWELGPDNAPIYGQPYTELHGAVGWLPPYMRVQVTARWGWPAIPDQIALATQLLAARLYRRKDSPQGVLGSADWGVVRVSRVDPDVEALIAPFINHIIA